MQMPGRKYQAGSGSYRYSINGQEKESELNENITTALYWEYDSRIGRRWNVDPITKDWESPYACFGNNPINLVDPFGLDADEPKPKYKGLKSVTVRSTISKKLRTKIEKYAQKEGISFKQARQELEKDGNEKKFTYNPVAEAQNQRNAKMFHDANNVGSLMEKDIRRISTEITVDVLKGAATIEGFIPASITGAELWGMGTVLSKPVIGLATDKSLEYYLVVQSTLNTSRRKILIAIIELAIVKYGKDALYRKELWALSAEVKNYKDLLTPKVIETILKGLDFIIKKAQQF